MEIDANLIDSTEASSRARNGGESDCNSVRVKERISSTPLLPNCIHWSQDGRVAVVTDTNIMITTFCNREMEFYMQNPPILSKSFIFFPADIKNEHIPVDMTAHKQVRCKSASLPPLMQLIVHQRRISDPVARRTSSCAKTAPKIQKIYRFPKTNATHLSEWSGDLEAPVRMRPVRL